jgi:hypothetical protein
MDDNEDILNETLIRFDEHLRTKKFIDKIIYNYNKYIINKYDKIDVINTIKINIMKIIANKNIDYVIPNEFRIITDDNNDNINRIIYWSYYKTIYPDKDREIENKFIIQEKRLMRECNELREEIDNLKKYIRMIIIAIPVHIFIIETFYYFTQYWI